VRRVTNQANMHGWWEGKDFELVAGFDVPGLVTEAERPSAFGNLERRAKPTRVARMAGASWSYSRTIGPIA
jgi:hypothetical protein